MLETTEFEEIGLEETWQELEKRQKDQKKERKWGSENLVRKDSGTKSTWLEKELEKN